MRKICKALSAALMIFLLVVGLSGCSGEKESCVKLPEGGTVRSIEYQRLEETLFNSKSVEDVRKLLLDNPLFTRYFLDGNQYPSLDVVAERLLGLSKNASIDTLYKETLDKFGDLGELNEELLTAYSWLHYHFPERAKTPLVKTVITGLYNDLYVSDSVVVIGLDYFIGEGASFRPINTPHYILKRYEKESIVPLIFSFVSDQYAQFDRKDNTLLGDMINYGKSYYFTKRMMPCKPDTWIVGYDAEELAKVEANNDVIWAHFINKQLLYETDHFVKNKYIGERPSVYEIGDECPGRIARWLGWQIVNEYMRRNPGVTLQQLMDETDALKILNGSKYKPKGR